MDDTEPGNDAAYTDSTDNDEVILISLDEDDDTATPQNVLNHNSQHLHHEQHESDLEVVESDEEEITIIELSDTEIRESDVEEDDEIEIKQEVEDAEEEYVDFDPSQFGVIVTESELPDDLLGEPVDGVFRCKFCPQKHNTKENLIVHIERHVNNGSIRKCQYCEFYSAVTQTLREHEWKHTNSKPYRCDMCDFSCRLKGDLSRHQQTHSTQKRYQCSMCNYRAKTAGTLRRHKERHIPDLPRKFTCTLCGAAFKRSSALKSHIQRRHSDTKPILCKQCPFRCKSMWELNSHMAKHSNEHPYKCTWPGCSKTYKTRSDCTKHMKRHSGVKNYVCSVCGKGFFDSTMLSKHASAHSDVRNFECGDCLKKFKTKRALQSHVLIHQAVKPYQCDVCYKTFCTQNNLDTHKRVHEGGRPYQCPICLHGSREMEHLGAHIGFEHLHNFTYMCGLCRKPFGKSFQLQLHMQRCHKADMQGHEEVLVYEPEYLGLDLNPEPSDAFDPSTFAKILASENLLQRGAVDLKQETSVISTPSNNGSTTSTDNTTGILQTEEDLKLPPVVQLARFGGIPFCLVRKNSGFQLNCQKKGKKPSRWFMDVSHMTDGDRERHNAYLRKKRMGLLSVKRHSQSKVKGNTKASASKSRDKAQVWIGRAERKARRRRRQWDSDEDKESDEEEAYQLAQKLVCKVDTQQKASGFHVKAERVGSKPKKKTVLSKNVPKKALTCPSPQTDPAKYPVSSLSVKVAGAASDSSSEVNHESHSSGNKGTGFKQNKQPVNKKLVKKVMKSKAELKKQSSLPKLAVKKQNQKGLRRAQRRESCSSWVLALISPLPVSHYKTDLATMNTQCWTAAILSSADRGRFIVKPMKTEPSVVSGRSGVEEVSSGDLKEEFFVRCLQLKERTPTNDSATNINSNAINELSLGEEDEPSACDNTECSLSSQSDNMNKENSSMEQSPDSNLSGNQLNSCKGDSMLKETSECLSNMLEVLSADHVPHTSEMLLPCAEDVSNIHKWLETGKSLPAVENLVSGGDSQNSTKNTVQSQSLNTTCDSNFSEGSGNPLLSVPDKHKRMTVTEPLESCLSTTCHSDVNEEGGCSLDTRSRAVRTTSMVTTSQRISENLSSNAENIPDSQDNGHSQSVKSPSQQKTTTTCTAIKDISKKVPVICLKRIDEVQPKTSVSTNNAANFVSSTDDVNHHSVNNDQQERLLMNPSKSRCEERDEVLLTSKETNTENSLEAVSTFTEDHLMKDDQPYLTGKAVNDKTGPAVTGSPSSTEIRTDSGQLHSCSSPMESRNVDRAQELTKCLHVVTVDVCINPLPADKLHTFGIHKACLDVYPSSGLFTSHHRSEQTSVKKNNQSAAEKLPKTKSLLPKINQAKVKNAASCNQPVSDISMSLPDRKISDSPDVQSDDPAVGGLLLATAVSRKQKHFPPKILSRNRRPSFKVKEALASKNLSQKKKQIKPSVSKVPDQNKKQVKSNEQKGLKQKQAGNQNVEDPNHGTEEGESEFVPDVQVSSSNDSVTFKLGYDEPAASDTVHVVGTIGYKVGTPNEHLNKGQQGENVLIHSSDVNEHGIASDVPVAEFVTERQSVMPVTEFVTERQSGKESTSTSTKIARAKAIKLSPVSMKTTAEHKIGKKTVKPTNAEKVQVAEITGRDECSLITELNGTHHSFEDLSSAESTASSSTASSPRKSQRVRKVKPPVVHPHSQIIMDNFKTLQKKSPGTKLPTQAKSFGIFPPPHKCAAEVHDSGQAKQLLSSSKRTALPELSGDSEVGDFVVGERPPDHSGKSSMSTSPGMFNSEILSSSESEKMCHVNEKEPVTVEQQPLPDFRFSVQENSEMTNHHPNISNPDSKLNASAEYPSTKHSQDVTDSQPLAVEPENSAQMVAEPEKPAQMEEIPKSLTKSSTHADLERCLHEEIAISDENTTKDSSPHIHEESVVAAVNPATGTTPSSCQEEIAVASVSSVKDSSSDVCEKRASTPVSLTGDSSPEYHGNEEIAATLVISTGVSSPPQFQAEESVWNSVISIRDSNIQQFETEAVSASVIPARDSSPQKFETKESVSASVIPTRDSSPCQFETEEAVSTSVNSPCQLEVEEAVSTSVNSPCQLKVEEAVSTSVYSPCQLETEEAVSTSVVPTRDSSPCQLETEEAVSTSVISTRYSSPCQLETEEAVSTSVIPTRDSSPCQLETEEAVSTSVISTRDFSPCQLKTEEAVSTSVISTRDSSPCQLETEEAVSTSVISTSDSNLQYLKTEETASASVSPTRDSSPKYLETGVKDQESLSRVIQNEIQETNIEQASDVNEDQEKETLDIAGEYFQKFDGGAGDGSPENNKDLQNSAVANGISPTNNTSVPSLRVKTKSSSDKKQERRPSSKKCERKPLKRLKGKGKGRSGTKTGTSETKADPSSRDTSRKEQLKLWYKMNLTKARAARGNKCRAVNTLTLPKPSTSAASATAKNIIKKSLNSAFKIVKPPLGQSSSPSLKTTDNKAMKRKKKKFMYVEADMGVSSEPPLKKRGRRPGPKIVIDRSQANLCFEPPTEQLLFAVTEQINPSVSGELSSSISTKDATFSDEVSSLGLVQSCPGDSSVTELESTSSLPQFGEVPMLMAGEHLQPSQFSNSDLPDIRPQVNESTLLDIKPLIEELKYLNQTDTSAQVANPLASSLTEIMESNIVDAAVGEQLVSQLGAEADQQQQSETVAHNIFQSNNLVSYSSYNTTRRQPGRPVRGRRKMKDRDFMPQHKHKLEASILKDAERRRSERPRKLRLSGDQIRKAQQSQDSESDFDEGEEDVNGQSYNNDNNDIGNSSDIEFVDVNVDLTAQRKFLEDLRVDMFSYGEEEDDEEDAASVIGNLGSPIIQINAESNGLTQAFPSTGEAAVGSTTNIQLSIKTDFHGNPSDDVQLETLKNVSPSVLAKLEPSTENLLRNTISDVEVMRAGVLLGDPANAVTTCKMEGNSCNCLDKKPNIKDSKLGIMAQYCLYDQGTQDSADTKDIKPSLSSGVSDYTYSSVPKMSWGGLTAGIPSASDGLSVPSDILSQNVVQHKPFTQAGSGSHLSQSSSDGTGAGQEMSHSLPSVSGVGQLVSHQSLPSTSAFGQYVSSLPGVSTVGQHVSHDPPCGSVGQYMSQNSTGAVVEQFPSVNSLSVNSVGQYMSHNSSVISMGQCMLQTSPGISIEQNFPHSSSHATVGHFGLQNSQSVSVRHQQMSQGSPDVSGRPFTFPGQNTTWNSPSAVTTQNTLTNQVQVPIFTNLDSTVSPSLTIFVKTVDGQRVLLEDNPTSYINE